MSPTTRSITRVVFCSGKIYYDLLAAREERKADHVALLRVEQLYPFAADQARDLLARYSPSAEVVWAQEEPRNMGPWHFIRDQHPAPARRYPPRSPLRGPLGERQPRDGVGQAAPAGAGGNHQRRADSWRDLADAEGASGGAEEEVGLYCTEFKYAIRSATSCGLLKRGHAIPAVFMRRSICGPWRHNAEMIVTSEYLAACPGN